MLLQIPACRAPPPLSAVSLPKSPCFVLQTLLAWSPSLCLLGLPGSTPARIIHDTTNDADDVLLSRAVLCLASVSSSLALQDNARGPSVSGAGDEARWAAHLLCECGCFVDLLAFAAHMMGFCRPPASPSLAHGNARLAVRQMLRDLPTNKDPKWGYDEQDKTPVACNGCPVSMHLMFPGHAEVDAWFAKAIEHGSVATMPLKVPSPAFLLPFLPAASSSIVHAGFRFRPFVTFLPPAPPPNLRTRPGKCAWAPLPTLSATVGVCRRRPRAMTVPSPPLHRPLRRRPRPPNRFYQCCGAEMDPQGPNNKMQVPRCALVVPTASGEYLSKAVRENHSGWFFKGVALDSGSHNGAGVWFYLTKKLNRQTLLRKSES